MTAAEQVRDATRATTDAAWARQMISAAEVEDAHRTGLAAAWTPEPPSPIAAVVTAFVGGMLVSAIGIGVTLLALAGAIGLGWW